MSTISGYGFDGPYDINSDFNNLSGVYVIHDGNKCLDVGETGNLKERIPGHTRKACWKRNAGSGKTVKLEFLQVNDEQKRLEIESYLRAELNPSCGEQ